MTAVMTAGRAALTLFDGAGGEPVLDEVLVRAWEGLAAHRAVACPVCGAQMRPEYAAHALPIGGRCAHCGSTLS
jgi:DNA-directed RNA polymerase subunit RPC12/RpoP